MPDTLPIEDKPNLRSFLRTTTEWSFTTAMWAIWIYLFLPLVSLALWVLGVPYLYQTLFREEVLQQLSTLMQRMGWTVLVIFVCLRGWGLYNYYVFGRRNRRKQSDPVTPEALARHFNLTPEAVRALQARKEIVWTVLYDEIRPGAGRRP